MYFCASTSYFIMLNQSLVNTSNALSETNTALDNTNKTLDATNTELDEVVNAVAARAVTEEAKSNPGIRYQADGYCHCFHSATFIGTGSALDVTFPLRKAFRGDALVNVRIDPATGENWLTAHVHAVLAGNQVRVICNQAVTGLYAVYVNVIGYTV